MANIGKIQSISDGKFFVKDLSGNLIELKIGDTVSLNDVVVGANSNTQNSKIEILFDTNELVTLSQGEQMLDTTLLASTFGNEELSFDNKAVDETLNAWNTASENIEDMETAAGEETNAGDEANGDGGALRSKFNSRDGGETDVNSDLREVSFGDTQANNVELDNTISDEFLNPTQTTTVITTPSEPVDTRVEASKITLSNPTVNEGVDITITATVDNAPQTDLIITLDNGEKIIIKAGETSGNVTFTNPNSDDVYNDGETIVYTIKETEGGNYKNLDSSDKSTVVVNDTIDVTTVKITGTDTTEGGKATFEIELSNKPQTGTTATGKVEVDGKSYDVTFDADGKATLTVDVKANDVYNGEPTITAKVTEITGGNFEKVNPNAQTEIKVKDIEDVTTVKITGTDTTEGGKATFEIELSNKPQTGTTATGKVEVDGKSYDVTFDADGKATLTVDVKANDVYNGEPTITAKVTEITGGNFEKVNPNAQTEIKVKDIEDVTTVTLNGEVNKDQITITAKVDNAPQIDLTITLSNGKTILIEAGKTEGSTIFTTPVQTGGKFDYTITSTEGGNYEALDTNSTKTTVIVQDLVPPIVTLVGSSVTEANAGEVTGNKVVGTVTANIDKVQAKDLIITLSGGEQIIIKAGELSGSTEVITSRVDDAYKQETTYENVSIKSTSNPDINIVGKTATITIKDDIDPIDVTISATVTTPKILDVNTDLGQQTGVKIYAESDNGKAELVSIKGTNHDGFGVKTTDLKGKDVNLSNGDTKEIGVGERVVVEFEKDVNSLDVAFAWRHNGEVAKVTFKNDGQVVGYAEIKGGGSNTLARVEYYDKDGNLIKSVQAQGGTDKVDLSYTFELPDANGNLISFDKVEFSAPNREDDYLIHSIAYKEVLNPDVTDIITSSGNVTFDIQIDEKYPPQGKATAVVEVNGKIYNVALNATGRGTLTVDSKELGEDLANVKVKVLEVKGGNYEKVNSAEKDFDFTPTVENPISSNDKIVTSEDTPYTLKIDDFGDKLSVNTREFKITELPKNGTLYKTITQGETYFDKEGNKTVATKDTKVPVTKDQVISLADVKAGKVVFEPKEHSDEDGSFKFQVGDGKGNFSEDYTTEVEVKAVADAPVVTINIEKVGETTGTENNNSGTTGNNNGSTGGIETEDFWKGYNTKEDIIKTATYEKNEVNWSNNNGFTPGDDSVSVGTLNASINTGNGDDNIYVSGNVNQSISAGAGDDKIFIKGSVEQSWTIDLGEGNNHLHVKGDVGLVTGHSGNDTVLIEKNSTNTINLGDGNNELHIKGNAGSTITTGSGNDKVLIEGNSENSINLGAGNNELYINGTSKNTIDTGSGKDKVVIGGNANNDIRLGSGNDYLRVSGLVKGNLYGGEGIDTLQLDSYSKDDYGTSTLPKWKINGFESIMFKDGTYEVNSDGTLGDKVEPEVTVYNYNITLNTQLTDTDGSEKLSDITLKNIPENSKLFGVDGKEINANNDGTYTVKVDENGEAKVSLTNEKELSDTDLNSIKASATSTESENGDSSTTTVSHNLGGDIDLSGLQQIVNENGEINLQGNNTQDKLSLTLQDILDLSSKDNTIKISGDKFDSVSFKNTIGENGQEQSWTKTEGTGEDKGFDIYINSGDENLKVKVEQPISDGITN